jgi:hypothetical protein
MVVFDKNFSNRNTSQHAGSPVQKRDRTQQGIPERFF